MKTTQDIRSLFLISALALGLGVAARADDSMSADRAAPLAGSQSLLGLVYGTLEYSYVNLDGTSTHADNYRFSANQPLAFGLDGLLSYDYSRSGDIGGSRLTSHVFSVGLRAYSTAFNWGKPYVDAGAGYAKSRLAGAKDDSFVYNVALGAEIPLTMATSVMPAVRFVDAPDLAGSGKWNFGAKLNHWVDSRWAVSGGIEIDDDRNTSFTIGTNFRF